VSLEDLLPIYNCLWQEPEEVEGIRTIVIQALFHEYTSIFAYLREDLSNDIRVNRQHRATEKARKSMKVFDSNKKIYDNYYYHLLDHDTGNTYVFISDYQNLKQRTIGNLGQGGIIYKDPKNPNRSIIRSYNGGEMPMGASSVYLTRDEEYIYIDGVRFYIETLGRGERQTLPSKHGNVSGRDFYQELEELSTGIKHRTDEIVANILVSDQDKKEVTDYAQRLFVEIAHTRQDLEKLEG
jgi:MoxR-like ATPase